MSTYPLVPLGEICAVNPRKTRKKGSGCSDGDMVVSFVPMSAVDERLGTIAVREERPLSEVSKGFTAFEDGDILFAKITPCMENGKIALARNLVNGAGRGSTEFFVLRPGDRVLGEYVYHFVRQPLFREVAKTNFAGTAGQQRVPKSFMENALVALPPLSEQRKIIGVLNRATRMERLRIQAADHHREFISALFIKMFGDRDQIGARFPCAPLRYVATIGSGVTKGRRIDPANAIEVPYLRVANVQDGFLNLDEIKTITIRRGEEKKYGLALGDLVMTEGGDHDKLGRAAIWHGELSYCAHQNHVFRVRPCTEILLVDYLREVAGSAYGKAYFLSVAKQTTGIASINKTQLGDFSVPIPPIDLQTRYAGLVARAYSVVSTAGTASKTALDLNASLMSRLLG